MQADHPEPRERWGAIADWYADLASEPGWGFIAPMDDLARWIGSQPFAAGLYPHTSHLFLCVRLRPGTLPDEPGIVACVLPDGSFECKLRGRNGRLLARRVVPIGSARDAFAALVIRLGSET